MVEAIVVLGLMALLALAVVPQLNFQQGVGDDGTAQGSLDATLDAQVALMRSGGSFLSADRYGSVPPELQRSNPDLTFIAPQAPSTESTSVSVALSSEGTIVGLAAMGGNSTCWMARRDFAPAADSGDPLMVFAFSEADSGIACNGESALLVESTDGAGDSWGKPAAQG